MKQVVITVDAVGNMHVDSGPLTIEEAHAIVARANTEMIVARAGRVAAAEQRRVHLAGPGDLPRGQG